jgi:uncharacterized protein (DUF1697 family)
MPRFVAFLRAVNLGGRTVKMDRLRGLFEELGFSKVETFIASGNVIFEARSRIGGKLEGAIEKHLKDALGFEVATFVRSAEEIVAVESYKPFSESDLSVPDYSVYVAFLREEPDRRCAEALLDRRSDFDDFHIHRREAYWLCRGRFSESATSSTDLEKILQCSATVRNMTTVRKLVRLHFRET